MKIVVFGGSFNPIHTGHAIIAQTVSQRMDVDEVWMMVSPQNPLKIDKELLAEGERLRLVTKSVAPLKGVTASDFEFSLSRPSYTYKTLCELRKSFPQHEFRLLIGSDNWSLFHKWKNPEEILDEFGVLIYQRPDAEPVDVETLPPGAQLIENMPMMLISSTFIREKIRAGRDVRFLIPDVIYEETIRLYGK